MKNSHITKTWKKLEGSYYSAVYAPGKTGEWCIMEKDGWIQSVTVGGADAWVMLGHVFWSEDFSRTFLSILEEVYHRPETAGKLWETIYLEHIDRLPVRHPRLEQTQGKDTGQAERDKAFQPFKCIF